VVLWDEMEQWIKEITKDYDEISLIGSGGNINKLFNCNIIILSHGPINVS
jgi:hypothetical protein